MLEFSYIRGIIEGWYREGGKFGPTGAGGSFGEVLCYEIHENRQTFLWLAERWGISVTLLGLLIADHCVRLENIE